MVVKQAGRWLANRGHSYSYERYTLRELWAAGARWKIDSLERQNLFSHKGFDFRQVKKASGRGGSRSLAPGSVRSPSSARFSRAPSTGSEARGPGLMSTDPDDELEYPFSHWIERHPWLVSVTIGLLIGCTARFVSVRIGAVVDRARCGCVALSAAYRFRQ